MFEQLWWLRSIVFKPVQYSAGECRPVNWFGLVDTICLVEKFDCRICCACVL